LMGVKKKTKNFWRFLFLFFAPIRTGLRSDRGGVCSQRVKISLLMSGTITNSRLLCQQNSSDFSIAPLGFTEMVAPNAYILYSVERFVLRGDFRKVISFNRERLPSLLATFNTF
jgi:hypothetical protein